MSQFKRFKREKKQPEVKQEKETSPFPVVSAVDVAYDSVKQDDSNPSKAATGDQTEHETPRVTKLQNESSLQYDAEPIQIGQTNEKVELVDNAWRDQKMVENTCSDFREEEKH